MKHAFKKQIKRGLDLFFWIHAKVSTFTAKLIGPTVFNYGTKDKGWNLTTEDLLMFPKGSLGKVLGEFLKELGLEPLAGAEYHDAQHVILDYSISFKDEVALQFFMQGNGKKSIASVSTMIGAWCLLPTQWKYLRAAYEKGKRSNDISALNLKALLGQDLEQVKHALFKESHPETSKPSGFLNVA